MGVPDEIGTAGRRGRSSGETAAVTQFLSELRSLGETTAPLPTPELEAVFAAASSSRTRPHYARIAWRAALVAAAVIAGTVTAAANHSLPAPAQRVVSNVVNNVTPFHISTTPPGRVGPAPSPRHDDSGTNDRSGTREDRGSEGEGTGAAGAPARSLEPTEPGEDNSGQPARASGLGDRSAAGDESGPERPLAATAPQGHGARDSGDGPGAGGGDQGD